ncbi:hypothetical protein Nmel_011745 [Mimus melanotis]
MNQQKLFFGK